MASLAALALLLTLCAAAQSRALARREAHLAARWRRALILHADRGRAIERVESLAEAQIVAEAAVEGVTATVRAVHRGIAAIPFGLLEAVPGVRGTARVVRALHDLTANSVYGSITGLNRLAGRILRGAGDKKKKDA